jgi:hypothetical protein
LRRIASAVMTNLPPNFSTGAAAGAGRTPPTIGASVPGSIRSTSRFV